MMIGVVILLILWLVYVICAVLYILKLERDSMAIHQELLGDCDVSINSDTILQ